VESNPEASGHADGGARARFSRVASAGLVACGALAALVLSGATARANQVPAPAPSAREATPASDTATPPPLAPTPLFPDGNATPGAASADAPTAGAPATAAPAAPSSPATAAPASTPPSTPPPVAAPEAELTPTRRALPAPPQVPDAKVGTGFHVFDANYWLLGVGLSAPCQATAAEIEASFVPFTKNLVWFGFYAAAGVQGLRPPTRRPPSDLSPCFGEDVLEEDANGNGEIEVPPLSYERKHHTQTNSSRYDARGARVSGGVTGGWRFFAADLGYLYNGALRSRDDESSHRDVLGARLRLGLSFAMEVFSGGDVSYGLKCCDEDSETACECERYPVGISVFLYYGNELYYRRGEWWNDGLVGLTAKIALGVPE
jgi:hypothetical protein